ncbi:DUF2510 domain-containing protein [Rhodococcus sp. Q]|uniref:DUF2510 domain-containing protein n=1 Tax=Rhodococcus sp. Q TaxID=2502252 RepID=UPI001485C343|nr:DUF2510 domain-containing protein [Rhodococcus sp. Q]
MTGSNPEQPRSDSELPPAGWYRDAATQTIRWWDGEEWDTQDNPDVSGTLPPQSLPPRDQQSVGRLQQPSAFWDFVLRWRRIIIAAVALLPVIVVVAGFAANSRDEASYQEGWDDGVRYGETARALISAGGGGLTTAQVDSNCLTIALAAEGDYDIDDYQQGCLDGAYSVLE